MSRDATKSVSEQGWHKPACTVTAECCKLDILDVRRKGIVLSVERKQKR